MTTITLPKSQYELLKKRSSLYEALLRSFSKSKRGVEEYTPERIREFMDNDQVDPKIMIRIKRILNTRK